VLSVVVSAPGGCSPVLIENTRLAYVNYLKAKPGVVAASIAVKVACTDLVGCTVACGGGRGAGPQGSHGWGLRRVSALADARPGAGAEASAMRLALQPLAVA
jgi:hypothetical protein